eukprot:Plantae.Rhodophyta-Purpureofilum_apyrenoidigerum.ctg2941.p1 GENE.Plantae.Rhodophyta-Purpureofilum_apyrenoidigerum.ctg2941~~Plantae.Rhodophyta-Purpureofilum_apyrenoidigerum.ctg2941.p1  ORF type:complete len:269 (-),score=74.89 Plantae.Rhodophyta-Purpureofilum_apyrenoidigerum.ctg2941:996-1802(-)
MAGVDGDYYDILGLKPGASEKEVKSAYRKAALRWHPDKNPGNDAATEMFAKVYAAYEVLTNSELRQQFEKEKRAETYHVQRTKEMDATRQRMKEDLEKREKQAVEDEAVARKRKQRMEVSADMKGRMKQEIDRLRKEFEKEEREKQLASEKNRWSRGPSPVLIKWTSHQVFDEGTLLRELERYEKNPCLIMTKRGALVTFKAWEAQRNLFADREILGSRGLKIKGDEEEIKEQFSSKSKATERPDFGRYEEDTLAMMFGASEKKAKPG